MKKCWVVGAVLLASLALNVTLGSMLAGRGLPNHSHGLQMMMDRVSALPEASRAKVADIIERARPQLQNAAKDLKASRKQTFAYIKSKDYNRQEAEQKFAAGRAKLAALQASAQTMLLDISDKLTPEERTTLLQRKDGDDD